MVTLHNTGVYLLSGNEIVKDDPDGIARLSARFGDACPTKDEAKKKTIAYGILASHNAPQTHENVSDKLRITFDACVSHDITYVSIIQTARASGLTRFPMPYVLTNCHNSLCAVGGTINEDDHMFGLSAAKKYGGVYVPAHLAVIHQYMREMMSGCGKMILGSDSHTRYGALGTMAIGEGGGEISKQLLGHTYDIDMPEVVGVCLTGAPHKGVGPQDVALAIIGAVFKNGYVKNKIMEFFGEGVRNLSVEFRNGIDVMTTETTCLSSIWATDDKVQRYYSAHLRPHDYKDLAPCGMKDTAGAVSNTPDNVAYYDGLIEVDLSAIRPMIAMPFHPSNVFSIDELNDNLLDILHDVEQNASSLGYGTFSLRDKVVNNQLLVDQGVIAGCAGGTFDNICDATDILSGGNIGAHEFSLSVYPSSQPVFLSLIENGSVSRLMTSGATIRSAFCGPCFGAGDVPANGGLSIRHVTRNFPSREGSKPSNGQIAAVALMDARSIAATALNKGVLTAATDIDVNFTKPKFFFNKDVYDNRVYYGFDNPDDSVQLRFGPNIVSWPEMPALTVDALLRIVSFITDPVTTTDELIPSGETSSYRSNPLKLAEYTLSRKDPQYVGRAKAVQQMETDRQNGVPMVEKYDELADIYAAISDRFGALPGDIGIGSAIYAEKPGDGSAREQAASCQRVLGGLANIAREYATKRYRSNLMNWGMLPFCIQDDTIPFELGDYIYIPNLRDAIINKRDSVSAYNASRSFMPFALYLAEMTDNERDIILAGCLINYYKF